MAFHHKRRWLPLKDQPLTEMDRTIMYWEGKGKSRSEKKNLDDFC